MNELDLKKEVSRFRQLFKAFESLLGYRKRLGMADDQLAIDLCEFYAIWTAYKIGRCMGSTLNLETSPGHNEDENSLGFREIMPIYETIDRAAQDLLFAIAAKEKAAALGALKEMRVLSFCPMPGQVFSRMEDVASRARGRPQQVFLVDLAIFAAEVGEYQRARKYIQQARSFDPSSRELYNIYVIEGLIALDDGRADEAIQCLHSSSQACQTDVDCSIQCSLLAPNLELAEKLLEIGEPFVVLEYFAACHNVWQHHRPQIEEWIHIVESGDKPVLQIAGTSEAVDQLSRRINVQWMRGCFLEMQQGLAEPTTPMSPAQVLAGRERQQAEHKRRMNAHIARKLEYLEKDLAIPPDQSPSNSPEPAA